MDDADLEVGPFGRKAPFLLQRADIGAGQSGFSRIMAPTQDIAVIRRPILGRSCGALTRRSRLSTRFRGRQWRWRAAKRNHSDQDGGWRNPLHQDVHVLSHVGVVVGTTPLFLRWHFANIERDTFRLEQLLRFAAVCIGEIPPRTTLAQIARLFRRWGWPKALDDDAQRAVAVRAKRF